MCLLVGVRGELKVVDDRHFHSLPAQVLKQSVYRDKDTMKREGGRIREDCLGGGEGGTSSMK